MSIEVRNISKTFGNFVALSGVTLDLAAGKLVALLGPSGCGKTTLLRIIAGLEHADEGEVLLDGKDASRTHARERRVGSRITKGSPVAHRSTKLSPALIFRPTS